MIDHSPLLAWIVGVMACGLLTSIVAEPLVGPDVQAAKVRTAIAKAELSEVSLERVEKAIAFYLVESRLWDERWGRLLRDYGQKIAALEKQGARRALRQAITARDALLETRPALVRSPEPLQSVVSDKEWARLESLLME